MVKTYIGAGGSTGQSSANTTQYWFLSGQMNSAPSTTETKRQTIFRSAGALSNLYVRFTANSISGNTIVRTRKNAANGNQSVTFGSSATGEQVDNTNTDTVAATDKVAYQSVPGGSTGTFTSSVMSLLYAADTDTVTRMIGSDFSNYTTASTTWYNPLGTKESLNTTETNARMRMRKGGTLKNLGVNISANRATSTTMTLRKDASTDGNCTVTITGGGGTGWYEDTTHTDTVTAGEDWYQKTVTGTGSDTLTIDEYVVDFVSTNGDGVAVAARPTAASFADNATGYMAINGNLQSALATEANNKADARAAFDCSNLTCRVTSNGVSSNSTVTLRKNGADTTLIATITASTTGEFEDTTHTETVGTTDELNHEITIPSVAGSQTVGIANITMITHITPLTRIESNRILKWNNIGRIESNRVLKWNIIGRIASNRILKWNIIGRIQSNRILKWNIIGRIQSSRILKWNIIGRIQSNRILKWNIIERIQSNRILKWNISDLIRIQTNRILKWNINERIQSNRILKWNIIERIQSNRILKWNIIGRIASNRILKWNIQERIQSNRILKWNIIGRIQSSRILKWNIIGRIQSNRILKWNIIGRIQSNRILKWNIIERIQSNRILKWDILEIGLTRIQTSRILKWNINQRVQSNRILKWNILNLVTTSRILKWNIQQRIQSNRILKWNIIGRIQSSRILRWNIQQRIASSRILKWHITNRVQSSRILKWNILGRVQTSRILKWNMEGVTTAVGKTIEHFTVKAKEEIPRIGSFLRGLWDRVGDDEIRRD